MYLRDKEWSQKKIHVSRKLHRKLGYFFCCFSMLIVSHGWLEFGEYYAAGFEFIGPLNLVCVLTLFFILECRFKKMKRIFVPFDKRGLNVISEEEFEKRVKNGEHLVILDDLVLNVKEYADAHPGGSFLLTRNIGRDISKFYYGGYALDGNVADPMNASGRKLHGNIPNMIVNELIVGIYSREGAHTFSTEINRQKTNDVVKGVKTF